jgi:hypothetical protein
VRLDAVRVAAARSRALIDDVTVVSPEQRQQIVALGREVARDLEQLPIGDLGRCRAYGLSLASAVADGASMTVVLRMSDDVETEQQMIELLADHDRYGYENIARVLDAAVAIGEFDIGRLPRGYRVSSTPVSDAVVAAGEPLVVARLHEPAAIDVVSIRTGEAVASFAARDLLLESRAARRREGGLIDLVADDADHLYCWVASGQLPVVEFAKERWLMGATLLDADDGCLALWQNGALEHLRLDGQRSVVADLAVTMEDAVGWCDGTDFGVVAATRPNGDVVAWSQLSGARVITRGEELWNQAAWSRDGIPRFWGWQTSVAFDDYDGFPCARVGRSCRSGVVFWLLDVVTLSPLRAPFLIERPLIGATLAFGRWLVTAHAGSTNAAPGLALWDIAARTDEPVATALETVSADVHTPVVVDGDPSGFWSVQVHNEFAQNRNTLVACSWPTGDTTVLGERWYVKVWALADLQHRSER